MVQGVTHGGREFADHLRKCLVAGASALQGEIDAAEPDPLAVRHRDAQLPGRCAAIHGELQRIVVDTHGFQRLAHAVGRGDQEPLGAREVLRRLTEIGDHVVARLVVQTFQASRAVEAVVARGLAAARSRPGGTR